MAIFGKVTSWKQCVLVSISVVFLCAYFYLFSVLYAPVRTIPHVKLNNIRYILQWTGHDMAPLSFMGQGSSVFTSNGCEHTNCYVTSDRDYFDDLRQFDAIIFNGRSLWGLTTEDLPWTRSARQKYVFANMESSHNFPVCGRHYNDFFNWTWTYKLNSDSRWGYFNVFNSTNGVVAPKVEMRWPELDSVDSKTKSLLDSKSRAAAWFVSNCRSLSRREAVATWVARELEIHGHALHIYGRCGNLKCERNNSEQCLDMLAKHYYFYFAFENSLAEDYVTEKVSNALNNYAIPVVYGAANYSRFLPPGSYLDAGQLGPTRLAARMASIIKSHRSNDPSQYYDFFRWRNHYTFRLTAVKEDLCNQCKMLNDPEVVSKMTVYRNFTTWWNSKYYTCT